MENIFLKYPFLIDEPTSGQIQRHVSSMTYENAWDAMYDAYQLATQYDSAAVVTAYRDATQCEYVRSTPEVKSVLFWFYIHLEKHLMESQEYPDKIPELLSKIDMYNELIRRP